MLRYAVLSSLALLLPAGSIMADDTQPRSITTTGQSVIFVTPGELDCGVGKPRAINESAGYLEMSGRDNTQNSVQELPPDNDLEGKSLPLGQIGVRAQVTVTFDLTDLPSRPAAK